MDPAEIQRGHDFAEALYELVGERGPSDFTAGERELLAEHLLSAAVKWVMDRNQAKRARA